MQVAILYARKHLRYVIFANFANQSAFAKISYRKKKKLSWLELQLRLGCLNHRYSVSMPESRPLRKNIKAANFLAFTNNIIAEIWF